MELWIRSQDKSNLKKVNNIYVEEITKDYDSWVGNIYSQPYVITSDEGNLGFYATKERALEILDEIQSKLHGTFLLKAKEDSYANELIEAQKYFEKLNSIFPVIGAEKFDLEPINKDIYVYEMPQE